MGVHRSRRMYALNNHKFLPTPSGSAEQTERDADAARIDAELMGLDLGTDPFVAAVRATRMPMIITDPRQVDNPVVFANDAFCRLSGYTREEILGRNCRFLQGPDTDPVSIARVREAVAAMQSIEIDLRNYRKNGERFWNRLFLAPVRDAAGNLAYFFASQVDVTVERERLAGLETQKAALLAEQSERLREQEDSQARLRLATEAGQIGIWELNLRTGSLVTSRRFRRHFGRDAQTPLAHEEVLAAIHPDDAGFAATAFARSLSTGEDYAVRYRVLRADRATTWLEIRGQVLKDTDGVISHMVGTSVDITQRVQTEQISAALLELDNAFIQLGDSADLAYAAAEKVGRTLEVSRVGYGVVDLRAETISIERDWNAEGIKTLAGVLHFRDYGSYIDDLKRGETVVFTDATRDPRTAAKADALIAISAQSVINMPVTEQDGLVALLYLNHATAREWTHEELAFVREVAIRTRMASERRRAERELRGFATSLETQVAARTKDLMEAEAALRQSQKMEAVGQLTGGLAHDFNNLLTGISGSLELLSARLAQGKTTDLSRYIATAQGASRRAAALTHRLLAFSRRQTLDPKPTNVNRMVAGLEELIRRTVGPAVSLEIVGSAGLWTVEADPGQLENALLNLCINARDAMPDGGKLTIETCNRWLDERTAVPRDLPPGQYVSLCVSDSGTGMTPEVIAKAFDPFFTTKPMGQGTGLGLSMVYGFARQSGGHVRIYSELGQGAMVCIYLPRHHVNEHPAEDGLAPAGDVEAARGETVLIIDDEPSIRMLVADVLGELGYTTLEAGDGPEGLKLLESGGRIDLLVTDVGLPGGLNGRQVADAARTLRPALKVLFITGYAENAVLSHGHLDPGMHVLTKPFEMQALARKVKELIEGSKAG